MSFRRPAAPACLALALLLLVLARPLTAQDNATSSAPLDAQAVEQRIAEEEARAHAAMEALSRLSDEEQSLHGDLAEAQARMDELQAGIDEQELRLEQAEAQAEVVRAQLAEQRGLRDAAEGELLALLRGLWPLHVLNLAGRGRNVDTWERADREFTWMAAVYRAVNRKHQEVLDQEALIRGTLETQETLAASIREAIAAVNKDKDGLLAQRLDFMRRLAEVRRQMLTQDEEMQVILAAIEDLKYDLSAGRPPEGQTLDKARGELPWPAQGEIVTRWAPREDPPRRGVGLSLEQDAPVRSVYWGKVVHDGVLRGFGRVIIVLHEGDYYSLYAFLSESEITVGQDVAQGQTLGRAGFYPEADSVGLYFELRFGPRPVNPEEWLQEAG